MEIHPFRWIRGQSRGPIFWLFTGLAILTMTALQLLGVPLKTQQAPAGIVSFELAGSLDNTQAILRSWDQVARTYAGLNLGLDFLFIDAYVGAIGLGCILIGTRLRSAWRGSGMAATLLAWAIVLAGALDIIENYALTRLLLGAQAPFLSLLARFCAIPKFVIVLISLLYIMLGLVASLVVPRPGRQGDAA